MLLVVETPLSFTPQTVASNSTIKQMFRTTWQDFGEQLRLICMTGPLLKGPIWQRNNQLSVAAWQIWKAEVLAWLLAFTDAHLLARLGNTVLAVHKQLKLALHHSWARTSKIQAGCRLSSSVKACQEITVGSSALFQPRQTSFFGRGHCQAPAIPENNWGSRHTVG
jgi:hypothetical protein